MSQQSQLYRQIDNKNVNNISPPKVPNKNLLLNAFAQTPASHRLYSDDSNNNKLSWLPASIKTEISAAIINDVFKSVQTVARLKQVIDQLISLKMAPTKEMVDKMFEVLLPAGNRLTLALEIKAKLAKHKLESSPLIELPIKIATTVHTYSRAARVIKLLTEYIKHNGGTPSEDVIKRVSEFYKHHNKPHQAQQYVQELIERHRRKVGARVSYKKSGLTYNQMIELAITHSQQPVTLNKIVAYIQTHFSEHISHTRDLARIIQACINKEPDLFASYLFQPEERSKEMHEHPRLYEDPISKRPIVPRKYFKINAESPLAKGYTADTQLSQLHSDVAFRELSDESRKSLHEFIIYWDSNRTKKLYNNWELLARNTIEKMKEKKGSWSKARFLRIARTLLRPKTYLLTHSTEELGFNILPYFFDYVEKNKITLIEPKSSPGRPKKNKEATTVTTAEKDGSVEENKSSL
jgi:hypothetical protein